MATSRERSTPTYRFRVNAVTASASAAVVVTPPAGRGEAGGRTEESAARGESSPGRTETSGRRG
jgi:hypothetical protein